MNVAKVCWWSCDEVLYQNCCDEVAMKLRWSSISKLLRWSCDEVLYQNCCDEVLYQNCCDEVAMKLRWSCDESFVRVCCDKNVELTRLHIWILWIIYRSFVLRNLLRNLLRWRCCRNFVMKNLMNNLMKYCFIICCVKKWNDVQSIVS